MTLTERISRQQGSHLVRLPRKAVLALIAERDAAVLKAQAWDRYMRGQTKRRHADRLARAIASNPKGQRL